MEQTDRNGVPMRKNPPPTANKPYRSKATSTAGLPRLENNQTSLSLLASHRSMSMVSNDSAFTEEKDQFINGSNSDSLEDSLVLGVSSDCPKHPHERLKYYCQFHDEMVCADCLAMDAKHQGHKHIRSEEMIKDYRTNLKAQLLPLEEHYERANNSLVAMDQRMKELLANGTEMKEAIKACVSKLITLLESREVAMLEEVDNIVSHKMKQHSAHQAFLEKNIEEMARVIQSTSAVANDNTEKILYCYKELSVSLLESTRKFQSLPNEVFLPLQGPNISFIPDHTIEERCMVVGTISQRQADAGQSFIDEASAKSLTINKQAVVQLVVNDSEGKPYTNHVPGLNMEIVSTSSSAVVNFTFEQDKSNKSLYRVMFTPREGCEHIIKARIGTTPLSNSPVIAVVSTIVCGEVIGEIKGVLQPYGLAVTDNEILVVENGKDCVSIHGTDGKTTKPRNITGKGNKKLTRPRGVIVRPNNHLLITDEEGLKQCTMDGKHLGIVGKQGNGSLEFNTPSGMTITRDGLVLVCDTFNGRVQILDQDLNFSGYMGEDGQLNAPYDIAVNSHNMFYVADYSANAIKIFSNHGECIGKIETKDNNERLKNPVSIHVNKKDHVFVGEEKGSGVLVFDAHGKFLMTIPIKLTGCHGISSDKNGLIYICDRANRRIIVYK